MQNSQNNGICRKDIPYPSVSNESVPSLVDNLVYALYGTITKTVINGRVQWYIPCDPDNTAVVNGLPRNTGEGLLCYMIRVFNSYGPANLVTLNGLQTLQNKTLVNPGLQGFNSSGTVNFNGGTITFNSATINFDGSTLTLPTSCVTSANIVNGTIVNDDINASASISYSKLNLANSIVNADINTSAGIVYSKLNLSGGIVNADINTSAAIVYSKLNLSNSIVNADIASAAAIADSKLATITTAGKVANSATSATDANTSGAIVARNGSGNFSAGTITASLTGNVSGNATTATTATNLANGSAGSIPYQTASSTTTMLSLGTTGKMLVANSSSPIWATDHLGTATNDNASSGYVGEYASSTRSSGTAITLTTAVTGDVTSISLTAGDWDVWGVVDFTLTSATSTFGSNGYKGGVNAGTASLGAQDTYFNFPIDLTNKSGAFNFSVPKVRFSLSSTTTIYLVAQSTFTAGTVQAYGSIKARRIR